MAVSCEISNVLGHYANTIYMTDQTLCDGDNFLQLPIADLPFEMTGKSNWSNVVPFLWSNQDVLEWISYHVEENKWDASAIDFSCCNMDGPLLCRLSREDLVAMFGTPGEKLYSHLWELNGDLFSEWNQLLTDFMSHDVQFGDLQFPIDPSKNTNEMLPCDRVSMTNLTLAGSMNPWENEIFDPVDSPNSEGSTSSMTPSSLDYTGSGDSESDLDRSDSKSSLLIDEYSHYGESDQKQQKRKRGRPRKIGKDNRDCLESKKNKHSSRGSHLWEFIRDILIHPERNEGLMKWEDRSEGIFKFLRSEAVAQLWGQKKKNTSMTYEKLSRAMRYYYKREILERVDGRRLVYKFGKNSSGWKEEEALSNQS